MIIIQQTLKYTVWVCKYLGEILRDLALQKECEILEGHLISDHVYILIPRTYMGRRKNFTGQIFWTRGHLYLS